MHSPADWSLTREERGNPATSLPAWTEGNLVEPLVHGTEYSERLVEAVQRLDVGDHLFFTDWRGDPDEELRPGGPTVAQLFTEAVRRGVCVADWSGARTGTARPSARGRTVPSTWIASTAAR